MKKLISLFVVFVFLFSIVPMAFAEQNTASVMAEPGPSVDAVSAEPIAEPAPFKAKEGPQVQLVDKKQARVHKLKTQREKSVERIKNIERLKAAEKVKIQRLDRERLKEFASLTAEQVKAKLGELKVKRIKKEDLLRKRVIAKVKLEAARERFADAKAKATKLRQAYSDKKADFEERRDKFKACKDTDSEECEELKQELIEKTKEYLVNSADRAIAALEKIQANVEGNDDIPEDEAQEAVEELEESIAALEESKEDIEAAETKEEVNEAAEQIRNEWRKHKAKALRYANRAIHSKVGEIIIKSQQLEKRLDLTLEKLAEKGYDTSAVDTLVEEFSAKVQEAKDKWDEAKDILAEQREADEPSEEKIDEAKKLIRESHESLKDAHKLLRDIVQTIKEFNENVASEEELAEDEGVESGETVIVVDEEEEEELLDAEDVSDKELEESKDETEDDFEDKSETDNEEESDEEGDDTEDNVKESE